MPNCCITDLNYYILSSFSDGFFPKILAPTILISYSTINGNAIMTWVTTSGGVKMAAPTKNNRSAYFLFFFKKLTDTILPHGWKGLYYFRGKP